MEKRHMRSAEDIPVMNYRKLLALLLILWMIVALSPLLAQETEGQSRATSTKANSSSATGTSEVAISQSMTREDVTRLLGETYMHAKGGKPEKWIYKDGTRIIFKDGKVHDWNEGLIFKAYRGYHEALMCVIKDAQQTVDACREHNIIPGLAPNRALREPKRKDRSLFECVQRYRRRLRYLAQWLRKMEDQYKRLDNVSQSGVYGLGLNDTNGNHSFGIPNQGVRVTDVMEGSPADKSIIREGDIIGAFRG